MGMLNLQEKSSVEMVRSRAGNDGLDLKGRFVIEHWRDGEKIGEYEIHNLVTNEAKNRLFNTMFNSGTSAGTPITNWCVGLINATNATTSPTLVATDSYANNGVSNSWTEYTGYTGGVRPAWGQGAAASQAITNATAAVFTISAGLVNQPIAGAFICGGAAGSAGVPGDHTAWSSGTVGGILWSEGLFTSGINTANGGDQLKFTYSVSA